MKTNEEYHADRTHLSSSALKLLLKSPQEFKAYWFDGVLEDKNKPAFEEGTLTHSLILEPETLSKYAIYPGLRRQGKAWEDFKAANADRLILTAPQELRCRNYLEAYQGRIEAVRMLTGGIAEHSMTGELLGTKLKARADYINIDKGYIVDVKTTSMPAGVEFFKFAVNDYGYHLSAALYMDIASQVYKKPFDFYWIVISKTDLICDIYKMSQSNLQLGHELLYRSIHMFNNKVWLAKDSKPSYDSKEYEILEV